MINVLSKFSFHANREESLWKRKEAEHGHSISKGVITALKTFTIVPIPRHWS